MSVWTALAGGFAGTLVLATTLAGATQAGLTRMDIPFLLGTAITPQRERARVVGYALHFVLGLVFALGYFALFTAVGRASWWLGALFGLFHGVFAGTVLVNAILPVVHPLMGTPATAADAAPLLEPPGFMMVNYGRGTVVVSLLAHVAYGAIIGTFLSWSP